MISAAGGPLYLVMIVLKLIDTAHAYSTRSTDATASYAT